MKKEVAIKIALESIAFNVPSNTKGISIELLIAGLSNYKRTALGLVLGFTSEGGRTKFLKRCFPHKPSNIEYTTYLFSLIEHKECSGCGEVLPYGDFHTNLSRSSKLQNLCKSCHLEFQRKNNTAYAANNAKYKASKLLRTPQWANLEAIKEFYLLCPQGYHVDHIVPLQGLTVSGLHVLENLQYLTSGENCSKGNRFILG